MKSTQKKVTQRLAKSVAIALKSLKKNQGELNREWKKIGSQENTEENRLKLVTLLGAHRQLKSDLAIVESLRSQLPRYRGRVSEEPKDAFYYRCYICGDQATYNRDIGKSLPACGVCNERWAKRMVVFPCPTNPDSNWSFCRQCQRMKHPCDDCLWEGRKLNQQIITAAARAHRAIPPSSYWDPKTDVQQAYRAHLKTQRRAASSKKAK